MTFSCPKCGYQNTKGSSQCLRCLLVFEKHQNAALGVVHQVAGSSGLNDLWGFVITDYGNKDTHDRFIQASVAQKNLAFASQQYRKMVELNPLDDIALKMRDRIIQLATASFIPTARPALLKQKRWGFKLFVFLVFLVGLILVLQVLLK